MSTTFTDERREMQVQVVVTLLLLTKYWISGYFLTGMSAVVYKSLHMALLFPFLSVSPPHPNPISWKVYLLPDCTWMWKYFWERGASHCVLLNNHYFSHSFSALPPSLSSFSLPFSAFLCFLPLSLTQPSIPLLRTFQNLFPTVCSHRDNTDRAS